jgi:iron complex transport system substrate-binding protein
VSLCRVSGKIEAVLENREKQEKVVLRVIKFCLSTVLSCIVLSSAAFAAPSVRIVSLAPAATEILYDLGLEDRIAAVTDFCDYPAKAKNKPKIGGFANPSLESIIAAKPDLVIMMEGGNPLETFNRLKKMGIKTYTFHAKRLRELPQGIRELGVVLGIQDIANRRAAEIEMQFNKYAKKAQQLAARRGSKKVIFVIQAAPLIAAGPGTVIDDALTLLGLQNIAADAGAPYPKYSVEEVVKRSPDVIFFGQGPMSKKVPKALLQRLDSMDTVKKGHVYYTSEMLYRLTPKTILGMEEIVNHLNKI